MTHDELNNEFVAYRARQEKWLNALRGAAGSLVAEVEKQLALQSPQYRDMNGVRHNFVDVYALGKDAPTLMPSHSDEFYQGIVGEILTFAVGVTLERAPNAFPKQIMSTPMAVRAMNGALEYVRWDRENQAPISGKNWQSDTAAEASALIAGIEDALKQDPMKGPPEKFGVGFI